MISSGRSRGSRVGCVWAAVTALLAADVTLTLPVLRRPTDTTDFDVLLVLTCSVAALVAGLRLWWIATAIAYTALSGRNTTTRWRDAGPLTRWLILAFGAAALAAAGTAGPATADSGSHDDSAGSRANGSSAVLNGLPLPDRATGGPVDEVDRAGRTPATPEPPTSDPPAPESPASESAPQPTRDRSTPTRTTPAAPRTSPAPPRTRRDHHRGRHVVVQQGDTLWAIAERQLGPMATVRDIAAYVVAVHRRNRSTIGADPDLIHPGQRLRLPAD